MLRTTSRPHVENLETRTLLSAVAGSAYAGFGNAGTLAGYQVLGAQNNGYLIASNAADKLVLLHPDGSLAGSYSGPRPLAVPKQNVQSDGKSLIVKNDVLTRFNSNGTLDKTFGVNGSVSNFAVAESRDATQFNVQNVAVDGNKIFVNGWDTYNFSDGRGTEPFVEKITPSGKIDLTFGQHGIAHPPNSALPFVAQFTFFLEIGPDHQLYSADDYDCNPVVERFNEAGVPTGTAFKYGATEHETVAGIAFQRDGKILIFTKQFFHAASLMRYNPDMTVDPTFGDKGLVHVVPPSGMTVDNLPTNVFVRADGVIFASGVFNVENPQGVTQPYSFAYNPGVRPNSSAISGHIYEDVNKNGKLDAADRPLRYWAAYVDLNNDGVWEAGEPIAYADYNGYFKIDGLAAGKYTLREMKQAGWAQTQPATSGGAYQVVLSANHLVGLRDFGNRFVGVRLGA